MALTILQDYSGDHLWSGMNTVQVYFCGVQSLMDFMGPANPQKLMYIVLE